MQILALCSFRRLVLAVTALAGLAGCKPAAETDGHGPHTVNKPSTDVSQDESLRQLIDDQLEFTIRKRLLNANEQAAWQVVHGALAYSREFPLQQGDKTVKAIDYLLAGGRLKGWNLVTGDKLDEAGERLGVRAIVEKGSLTGQGHNDQWLGYLSGCGLTLDDKIVVQGREHTLGDYLAQVEHDVHLNMDREYSWTLMAMTAYHPTDYTWTAGDGSTWTIPKLVDYELDHDLLSSSCGGMHRLSGLAMARNRHRDAGGKMEGTWARCDEVIKQSVAKIREFQNADGTLSASFLRQPGKSADLPSAMHASGHTLEFVILASNKEELRQPWIRSAVVRLCDLFKKTQPLDVECGALYHAAHALIVYREQIYGPRQYSAEEPTATPEPMPEAKPAS